MQPSDLRMLDILRRGYGMLLIMNIALLWIDRHELFGAGSYLPAQAARGVVDQDTFNLYMIFPDHPASITFALLVIAFCGVLMIIGSWPRIAAAVTLFFLTSVHHANVMLVDAEDSVFRLFAFFLIFVPPWKTLRRQRTDADPAEPQAVIYPAWPLRLFQLQICIIYFCSGIQKSNGQEWLDGTAYYYVNRLDDLTLLHVPAAITESMDWSQFLSWSTVGFELLIPFLIWIPKLRWPCLGVVFTFHVLADLSLNLHLFHWIMLLGLVSFVNYEEWDWLRRKLLRQQDDTQIMLNRFNGKNLPAFRTTEPARAIKPKPNPRREKETVK